MRMREGLRAEGRQRLDPHPRRPPHRPAAEGSTPMIDQPTLNAITSTLFAGLAMLSICVGILLTMGGAALLAFRPPQFAVARDAAKLPVALIAFGLSGFIGGLCALLRVAL